MTRSAHLTLSEIIIKPGGEWPNHDGWRLARLSEGHGYWLDRGEVRELETGQVLVIPPRTQGALRASQLAAVKLQYFDWRPELLTGILTLPERHFFTLADAQTSAPVRVLPSESEVGAHFESVLREPAGQAPMVSRSKLLQLIGEAVGDEISRTAAPAAATDLTASDRFERLIGALTDREILDYTPAALAKRCGCSSRHFARLFQKRFGVSVRARQTQLRLAKAKELLASNDHKIIDVALDSGYRNLGLFNKLFKKHVGATPSQWRKKNTAPAGPPPTVWTRRRWQAAAIVSIFFAGLFGLATAGWAGPTNAPAAHAATNAEPTFKVTGYKVEGNTTLPADIVDRTMAPFTGEAVTFETIHKGLTELQMAYRSRGFMTIKVGLPQQQLTNGFVRVLVTEGRLTEITISKNRYFGSNNIMRALPSLRTNILLNSLVFQQDLDAANANRDRQIYPEIAPGPEPGTTALRLKVIDRLPLHARLDVDNESSPDTPDIRVGGSAQYNNLWDLDHQFGLQYMFSPSGMKETGHKLSWPVDDPKFVSYSGFYRMPIFWGKSEAATAGPPGAGFGYDEITHKFKAPPTLGNPELIMYASRSVVDTGNNLQTNSPFGGVPGLVGNKALFVESLSFTENLGFRFTHPLPSFWKINSSWSAGVDYKAFHQIGIQRAEVQSFLVFSNSAPPPVFVTNTISSPPPTTQYAPTSVEYLPIAFNWDGNREDRWGMTSLYIDQTLNLNPLSASSRAQFATVAQTSIAKSDGNFYIVVAGMTREFKLPEDFGVTLRAEGQWASQTLIGNEQFALGGTVGPRGYHDGDQYGDAGWRASIEPHTPYYQVTMINYTIPVTLQASIFTDYGRRILYSPKFLDTDGVPVGTGGRDASVDLWGAGIALNGTIGQTFDFHFIIGFPLLDGVGSEHTKAGDARVEFSLSAQF